MPFKYSGNLGELDATKNNCQLSNVFVPNLNKKKYRLSLESCIVAIFKEFQEIVVYDLYFLEHQNNLAKGWG